MNTHLAIPDGAALLQAAALLKAGEVVAFPTETVYGLGANALDPAAVEKIFAAKGRPGDNPLIVHIADRRALPALIAGEPSAAARILMDAFWPGPLTLILPKGPAVPARVTAGLQTVAVRMPAHPVARNLIEAAGLPIAAPSANRSGRPSPTRALDVLEDMDGRIPLILDGGPCEVGLESTVVDLTGEIPRILRPGGVTEKEINALLGKSEIDRAVLRPLDAGEQPRSPGMKYRHYAPEGEVVIVRGSGMVAEIIRRYDESGEALILALSGNLPRYGDRRALSLGADARAMGQNLFGALREADRLGAKLILAEGVEATGVGLAVMNRLLRAAAFRIIEV